MMERSPAEFRKTGRLIADLHDGLLDDAQSSQLEQMLADNPAARQQYLDYVMMHVLLEVKHEPALRAATAAEVGTLVADHQEPETPKQSGSTQREAEIPGSKRILKRNPSIQFRWAAGLLALACTLCAVWLGGDLTGYFGNAEPDYIAVLTNTTRAKWLSEAPGQAPVRLREGRSLQLMDGLAEVTLSSGAVVVVRGPADLQLVSPMHVKANRGTVRARVGEDATGFVIETPNADVVDLGTEFGVNVSESGGTDVVVFEGAVDLAYHAEKASRGRSHRSTRSNGLTQRKRLNSGEALHVDSLGAIRRIVSVDSDSYPATAAVFSTPRRRPPVISGVTDNIRDPENAQYYQVVHQGLREDARTYVDRYHEWNGVDAEGMPDFLLAADYVMTFNSDKWQSDIEIGVQINCPAVLYVFYDDRLSVPNWLSERFIDTGYDIGVDEGFPSNPRMKQLNATGPGRSIDTRYSIWRLNVARAGTVTLGALAEQEIGVSMYGIAAVPASGGEAIRVVPSHEGHIADLLYPNNEYRKTVCGLWSQVLSDNLSL